MGVVAEIWRYPVKSMAGERLAEGLVDAGGLEGDREYALIDRSPARNGKFVAARHVDQLLGHRARQLANGVEVTCPDGVSLAPDSLELAARLEATTGRQVELQRSPGANFDDSPLLLVNLATVERLSQHLGAPLDHRRFRANLYLRGLEPGEEIGWVGRRLRVGGAVLEGVSRCERCVVVTIDPGSLETKPELLRLLAQREAACMGVYCQVREPGRIAIGDSVAAS